MRIADHMHFAAIGENGVVLDLVKDRYFALSPPLTRATLRLVSPNASVAETDVPAAARARLLEMGLVAEDLGARRPRPPTPPGPAETCWPAYSRKAPPVATFLAVLRALFDAWWLLRSRPFHRVVASLADTATPALRRGSETALHDGFHAVRPWFPVKPICRLDAIALLLHLRRNGHPAQLVFGVRLEKFGAHCWVQTGRRVFNEPHEVVARFTPIMVV